MLRHILDTSRIRVNRGKVVAIGFGLVATAVFMGFAMMYAFDTRPELVAFGFVTFAIPCASAIILNFVSLIITEFYLHKHHLDLWKRSKSITRNNKADALKEIKSLNDPYLRKLSRRMTRIGILCFLVWIVLFLVVAGIVFVAGESNFLKTFFEK